MISKNSTIFSLITILFIQIVAVKSQFSVNPITPSNQPTKTPDPTPSPTPSDIPISLTNHIVKVGFNDYGFSRNNFSVSRGDVLHWEWVGNIEHSVVESTIESPCKRKENGFDLGRHTSPYNYTMAFSDLNTTTVVFFSDVSGDCAKGMYGGMNLPQDYVWPNDLTQPPAQIFTTPLNPTPTPTGSMTIVAEPTDKPQNSGASQTSQGSGKAQGSGTPQASGGSSSGSNNNSTKPSSGSASSIDGIIIGSLALISLYFIM